MHLMTNTFNSIYLYCDDWKLVTFSFMVLVNVSCKAMCKYLVDDDFSSSQC